MARSYSIPCAWCRCASPPSKYDVIKPKLRKAATVKPRPQAGHIAVENIVQSTEFFIYNKGVTGLAFSKEEQAFVDM